MQGTLLTEGLLSFRHELEHIKNGDFYTDEDVRDKEDRIPF